MSGVKGRSGRRPMRDEEKRLKIIDKAWEIADQYLHDETIALKDRIEVACKIIVKDMPDKLTDGEGGMLPVPIVNVYVTKNTSDRYLHPGESPADIGEQRLPI